MPNTIKEILDTLKVLEQDTLRIVQEKNNRITTLEAAVRVAIEKLEAFDENPQQETLVDEALLALNQSIGRM